MQELEKDMELEAALRDASNDQGLYERFKPQKKHLTELVEGMA